MLPLLFSIFSSFHQRRLKLGKSNEKWVKKAFNQREAIHIKRKCSMMRMAEIIAVRINNLGLETCNPLNYQKKDFFDRDCKILRRQS